MRNLQKDSEINDEDEMGLIEFVKTVFSWAWGLVRGKK
jgi:hypothetical protein